MPVLMNASLLAVCPAEGGQGEIGSIADPALVWEGERIQWVGPAAELPAHFQALPRIDAGGGLLIPGLVDCHTHLAFAGWRADEFEERIRGVSYLEIAERGGGILQTVQKTRAASPAELAARCLHFAAGMRDLGVTTIECKSGYGLSVKDELKLLEVYAEVAERDVVTIVPTFLGAHTVPAEHRADREVYLQLIIDQLIPAVAARKLARFCDVFMERSAFSGAETRRIFAAARDHGLGVKLHADQLSDGGGAALAAEFGAVSADHLEYTSDAGIDRLREAGTVAVILPFASLYTREAPVRARRFIDRGVPVAVATDFNPGSAPSFHLPMALTLACTMSGLTPGEALKGATINAARALGLAREIGSLEVGKQADMALIDAPDVNHWLYHLRANACRRVWRKGREVSAG